MTLRAWVTTMVGRLREALCPELAVLRQQNRALQQDVLEYQNWMKVASRRSQEAERRATALQRRVEGLKRHLARYEGREAETSKWHR